MTDKHPITPPLELVHQWADMLSSRSDHAVFSLAAQWGADQELEECCVEVAWLESLGVAKRMREHRRPKPPSLKEQALRILVENGTTLDGRIELEPEDIPIIRRALEALPND